MGRTTLRGRLTLLFGTTIFTVLSLVGLFLWTQTRDGFIRQARLTAQALAQGIAAAASNDFFSYNYVALEQKAEEAAKGSDVAYVVFYDKEGRVAARSGLGIPAGIEEAGELDPESLSVKEVIVEERLMAGHPGPGLDVFLPVRMPGSDQGWGFVRLGMKLDAIHRQIARMTWTIFFLGLAGLALAWGLSDYFTRRITIPLGRLVGATVRVSEGDLETRIEAATGDEVQNLAENFNWMVGRLKEQRDTLEGNLREIRSLKHYSDLILLSISNALVTVDRSGLLTTFNRKAEEIFGIAAEQAFGRTAAEVWVAAPRIVAMLEEGLGKGRTVDGVEIPWSRGEETRILELATALIQEPGTAPVGLIALFTDLTEKRDLEERVRRADRLAAMGTLASGLAHEIRNPLTAVRAFVQMLPDRYGQEGFLEKFGRIVPRELDRVNDLLENLLDLVRKPRMKIAPLDLARIIGNILETLEPEIERRHVTVKTVPDGGAVRIMADESYMARALHNIFLNAVQAMPGGGVLTVETGKTGRPGFSTTVELKVTDTGSGIPANQVKDIFNPFFTSKEKGTGLGLAVTNKIIEDQGGSIQVESQRGIGTTFILRLPAAKAE